MERDERLDAPLDGALDGVLDGALDGALAQQPVVRIPEGFAARVAAAAAAQPVARARARRRVSVGRVAAMVGLVLLGAVLFVVAPQAGTRVASWSFAVEMLVLAQMAGIGYGLMRMEWK